MSKIVRHSYGIRDTRDELELNRRSFEDQKRKTDLQGVLESNTRIAQIDEHSKDNEFIRRRTESIVTERMAMKTGTTLLEQGKNILLKTILTEAFIDSLVMDDYFVKENTDRFSQLVGNYVDKNGGYSMLEEAVKKHPIPLLKGIKEACDSIALQASLRIAREARENPALATKPIFELDEEEKDLFDGKRSELSMDKIAQLVKDKVLTVVKDERDRQSREKELMDDLEARAKETGEEVEKKPALGTAALKESTLFNSIMHNSYESYLETIKERFAPILKDKDKEEEDHDEHDALTAKQLTDKILLSTDDLKSPLNGDVNLDLIMCEAITYYTLMELTHTVCLETFQRNEIVNLSHKLLNKR